MTADTLLTGLIGAVIGGLIVVWAEQSRWRRENKAALRLLYYEVRRNRIVLEGTGRTLHLGSDSVWQAQQVRIASSLRDDDLNRIATAYIGFAGLLSSRSHVSSDKAWDQWLESEAGKEMIKGRLPFMVEAEAVLKRVLVGDERKGWLGVSGGGLVRL